MSTILQNAFIIFYLTITLSLFSQISTGTINLDLKKPRLDWIKVADGRNFLVGIQSKEGSSILEFDGHLNLKYRVTLDQKTVAKNSSYKLALNDNYLFLMQDYLGSLSSKRDLSIQRINRNTGEKLTKEFQLKDLELVDNAIIVEENLWLIQIEEENIQAHRFDLNTIRILPTIKINLPKPESGEWTYGFQIDDEIVFYGVNDFNYDADPYINSVLNVSLRYVSTDGEVVEKQEVQLTTEDLNIPKPYGFAYSSKSYSDHSTHITGAPAEINFYPESKAIVLSGHLTKLARNGYGTIKGEDHGIFLCEIDMESTRNLLFSYHHTPGTGSKFYTEPLILNLPKRSYLTLFLGKLKPAILYASIVSLSSSIDKSITKIDPKYSTGRGFYLGTAFIGRKRFEISNPVFVGSGWHYILAQLKDTPGYFEPLRKSINRCDKKDELLIEFGSTSVFSAYLPNKSNSLELQLITDSD